MGKCKFDIAWRGNCGKDTLGDSDYCQEHLGVKCSVCGEQATHECSETSSFVCGTALCDKAECITEHNRTIHKLSTKDTNNEVGNTKINELDAGKFILSSFKLFSLNAEDIGKLFMEAEGNTRLTYKKLVKDISPYLKDLLELLEDQDIKSQLLIKFSENAIMKYRVFNVKKTFETGEDFCIVDFSQHCKRFIFIEQVDSFSNKAGFNLLKEFLQNVKGIPVLLKAGITSYGLYGNGEDWEIDEELNRLESYYKSLGFENVNNKYGNYEESICMLNWNKEHLERLKAF